MVRIVSSDCNHENFNEIKYVNQLLLDNNWATSEMTVDHDRSVQKFITIVIKI